MKPVKRARLFSVFGALVTNGAAVYAIGNRSAPFGFGDIVVLLLMNGMFLGFYWLAFTRFGSQDLKETLNSDSEERPARKNPEK